MPTLVTITHVCPAMDAKLAPFYSNIFSRWFLNSSDWSIAVYYCPLCGEKLELPSWVKEGVK